MPIVDVELVAESLEYSDLASRLAKAVGDALDSQPGGTWVRIRHLDPVAYAENGVGADPRPIFVSILKADMLAPEDLASQLRVVTAAVATETGHPIENIHVVYEPAARGRIGFGGKLVE